MVVGILGLFTLNMCTISKMDNTGSNTHAISNTDRVDQWSLKSYQYVITLEDEDWIEVRHANGTIVGMVQLDSTSKLAQLFYKDNE